MERLFDAWVHENRRPSTDGGQRWSPTGEPSREGFGAVRPCGSDRGMVMQVHLSVATIEALNKILRTCRNMRHAIGREPTAEEIAGRLRMPPETIRKLIGTPPPLTRH